MATVITAGNATNGLSFTADNTGALEFKTGTGAGTTALTLSSSQIATFAGSVAGSTGTLYPIVSGTAVASTSGTSIDFTSIPSWVKRITVMFNGFSTNGSSNYLVQLGDSGGIEATGYLGTAAFIATTASTSAAFTTGFGFQNGGGSGTVNHGVMIINLLGSNTWDAIGNMSNTGTARTHFMAGGKSLSDTLDRIRITTVNGTDTFTAGSINILYE